MTNSLSVSSSMLLFLESFRGCFGTSSGTERPPLVKLPIEESVVKVLPSASSTILFVLHTTFCSTLILT